MPKGSRVAADALVALSGACAGLVAYVAPAMLLPLERRYEAPLFPLLRTGVEGYSFLTAGALVFAGCVLGFVRPARPWRWGLSTVAALPIAAWMEMQVDPTSHNLWPLESLFYVVEALPACAGARLGARARKKLKKLNGYED
jgi:hypothetical protein